MVPWNSFLATYFQESYDWRPYYRNKEGKIVERALRKSRLDVDA